MRPALAVLAVAVLLGGCATDARTDRSRIANPASEHCEEQGGRLEIRGEDGQVGVCVFEDGSECEEWAFYRGECRPGDGRHRAG